MAEAFFVELKDRGLLRVGGAEARPFLQGLISNDVGKISSRHSIYGALLTAQGRYLHDFFMLEWEGDTLLLDAEAARLADLKRRLTLYKLRSKVELTAPQDGLAVYAAFGPDALKGFELPPEAGLTKVVGGMHVLVDPRWPDLGLRIIGPADKVAPQLAELGFKREEAEAYHRLRIQCGLPDGSRDLPVEKAFLLEHNFEELNGVDFKKGCYVGQELTARTKYRGLVRKRLFRVDADTALPAPGTPIMLGEREAGTLYSSAANSGLALLRLEHVEEAEKSGIPLLAGDAKVTPVKPAYAKF